MSKQRPKVLGWAQTLCLVVLWLVSFPTEAAPGSEPGPVLVGYVQKLLPDRDGGDRQVAVEQARVAMKGTGNWVGSDAHGLFRLQLLRIIRPGQSIEVEVEGVPGWLLYQPADGRLVVPEVPQTVTLRLLPKGSLRFLEREGLASLLSRMMSEAKESARVSPLLPAGSAPPPVDHQGPMQKWASEYGLSLAQVQSAVDKWAQEVLARKQRDDEQVCLAHYSQQQLEQAALCFDALGQKDVKELERFKAQVLEQLKAQVLERTERAVGRFVKAADAYELRYDFAAALAEYEKAARWAKRDVSPSLWAEVQVGLGIVHWRLGIRVAGESSRTHLRQAIVAFRSMLEVHTKEDLPQHWAMTQNNLGIALSEQASRTPGTDGTALLAQAIVAYRSALEILTQKDFPRHWARTKNNLSNALSKQASWNPGTDGTALLAQAVLAFRSVLEVYTKQDLPQDWAMTQNNLGNALSRQASRTQGTEGIALLAQAVSAYRSALEVYTKQDLPQDWAMTQNNLGTALSDQASRTPGTDGTALLAQAVSAYRSALEVLTKMDLPQPWAVTQHNLGNALSLQASRTPGTEGTALLAQAVSAYRSALEVLTKMDLPQDCATTQNNLGAALRDQAQRLPPDSPARTELLTQAVGVFRAALEIHTQTVFPLDWMRAQMNLARACALLPDDRCAADSFANVLRVHPDWSEGYKEAYMRYYEKLFLFAEAYSLNQQWLSRHPDDLDVVTNFIESHLTTGRWAELSVQLAKVFPKVPPTQQVPLLAIETASLTAQNRIIEAAQKRKELRILLATQPPAYRLDWTFGGTRHYLQTEPRMAPHRQKLLALLSALEQPSRDAILTALDSCCMDAAK